MSADHRLTFYNQSHHVMTLTRNDGQCQCMTSKGPGAFTIAPGGTYVVMLEDTDDYKKGCQNVTKTVGWNVTENGGNSRNLVYNAFVSHDGVSVTGDIIYAMSNGSACVSYCWADRSGVPIPVDIYL